MYFTYSKLILSLGRFGFPICKLVVFLYFRLLYLWDSVVVALFKKNKQIEWFDLVSCRYQYLHIYARQCSNAYKLHNLKKKLIEN